MEIERKWMVSGWPQSLPLIKEEYMRQGYISASPTVRIREEAQDGVSHYILCFKSKGTLSRKEIEIEISKEKFAELEDLIGLPLIPKVRRTYALADGLHLEVNHVDQGLETEFWYAEVEYDSEEQALGWKPESVGLGGYLPEDKDVTHEPGQTMGAYWVATRLKGLEDQ